MTIHLKTTDIAVFGGKKEEGKSTLLKHHAKGLRCRILWDWNREHGDMGYVVYDIDEIGEALEKGLNHVVYQPITGDQRSKTGFKSFMAEVKRLSFYYSFVVIIEEVEYFAKPSNINLHKKFPSLHDLIQSGRFRYIGVWVTARIIRHLAEDITHNADHIFAFRVHRPQDVDYLEDWIGPKANMLSQAKAQKHDVDFIEKYHYLHFNGTETVLREPV